MTSPTQAERRGVMMKKTIVCSAIIPFIFALRLAAPVIRLAVIRGRIISFNRRINSSPGYDIRRIVLIEGSNIRRKIPRMKPLITPVKVRHNNKFSFDQALVLSKL